MYEQMETNSDELTLKEFIQRIREWWFYLKKQWIKIFSITIIGGSIGFVYASLQPINYVAKLTFVVEEGKSGGSNLGGLASLAGQFGVDVGSSSGGVLTGENILLYFKSHSLARQVLLSNYDNNSNLTIADYYANVYKLKELWAKNEKIGLVNFHSLSLNKPYSRLQDSLLQTIIDGINGKQFVLAKTDKKASFIEATAIMQNETLAKLYCERIVNVAIQRYVSIRMQRQKNTVDKLQSRVDSIARLLNMKTATGASLQTSTSTMDINPLYRANSIVANETTGRDKNILASIFVSVTQNLEMAKFTLSQETPDIQIVDAPFLPLKKEKMGRKNSAILFSLISGFAIIIILIGHKIFRNILD